MINFTINNEVQSWFGGSSLLPNVTFSGEVLEDCHDNFLSITAGSDPVNVGVIIVVVFFIILIFAILGSFFAYRSKKKKYEKMQNRSGNDSQGAVGFGLATKSYEEGRGPRQKKLTSTPQKPDVIERELVNQSPLGGPAGLLGQHGDAGAGHRARALRHRQRELHRALRHRRDLPLQGIPGPGPLRPRPRPQPHPPELAGGGGRGGGAAAEHAPGQAEPQQRDEPPDAAHPHLCQGNPIA